jgi:serine-type D-Ala-D-Ala carboxypeptidase/endopeptidase (penicillin-binding protein 4)
VRSGDRHRTVNRLGQAGRTALVLTLSAVVLLGAGAYAAYDAGWLNRILGGSEAVAPSAIPPPAGVQLPEAAPAQPVLDSAAQARSVPSPRRLRAHIAGSLRDSDYGPHMGVLIEALGRERDLVRVGGDDLFTPASSLKLLTTAAALELMGPDHRFRTTVVRPPEQARGNRGNGGNGGNRSTTEATEDIVLVGGGDPLLTRRPLGADTYPKPATLRALARSTADRLEADGVRRVRLGYDASLFTGPADNPRWEDDYVSGGVVSEISALWIDEGRVAPGLSTRSANPARDAALAFADELGRAGIVVTGTPQRETSPRKARTVAAVESPPLAQIVGHVLEISDNEAAEVLLRHSAIASGLPGSSANGARAVRRTLTRLGIDVKRARIYDGSGLSRQNRVTADMLVQTLQTAASPENPDLRRVVTGLPVAGFNGSLESRFVVFGSDGRGLVRAKTGTLTGVHALVGVTVDRGGAPLVFAAVADKVRPIDTLDARSELDALTADIATCC